MKKLLLHRDPPSQSDPAASPSTGARIFLESTSDLYLPSATSPPHLHHHRRFHPLRLSNRSQLSDLCVPPSPNCPTSSCFPCQYRRRYSSGTTTCSREFSERTVSFASCCPPCFCHEGSRTRTRSLSITADEGRRAYLSAPSI